MRLALEIRISLSESETTAIAVAAYYAKLPLNDWVKRQLLAQAGSSVAAVEMPKPAELPVASTPTIQPTEAPALEPPAVTEIDAAIAEEVSKKKKRKLVRSVDKVGVPRGFDVILEKAEKIHAGRMQVIQESGATRGRTYVLKLSKWYKELGFNNLDAATRSQLVIIGRNAAAIRKWHSNRPGSIPDNVVPSGVYSRWVREGGTPIEPEAPRDKVEEESEEESRPNDETIVFSATGIERRSLREITGRG